MVGVNFFDGILQFFLTQVYKHHFFRNLYRDRNHVKNVLTFRKSEFQISDKKKNETTMLLFLVLFGLIVSETIEPAYYNHIETVAF